MSLVLYIMFCLFVVTPYMELKPNCGSDKAWVWSTLADFVDEVAQSEMLAIRFANAESKLKSFYLNLLPIYLLKLFFLSRCSSFSQEQHICDRSNSSHSCRNCKLMTHQRPLDCQTARLVLAQHTVLTGLFSPWNEHLEGVWSVVLLSVGLLKCTS